MFFIPIYTFILWYICISFFIAPFILSCNHVCYTDVWLIPGVPEQVVVVTLIIASTFVPSAALCFVFMFIKT